MKNTHNKSLNYNVIHIIQNILNNDLQSISSISGGKNSRVYRVTCADKQDYIVKFYFSHQSDKRNRLKTEFSTLQFLHHNNVFNVPIILYKNDKFNFAILEYIKGTKIKSEEITNLDVDMLIDFLIILNRLKYNKESKKLSNASEACFTIDGYINNIQERLDRLEKLDKKQSTTDEMLFLYLKLAFIPAFRKIKQWCYSKNLCDQEISIHQKTLSPSDYGFHNALRLSDNQIKFIDFEYFGWDDPAKMISDFLLHPAMDLSFELKQYFYNTIIDKFENSSFLKQRIFIVYPLVALKWCMILLNEFVPEHLKRRNFSGDGQNKIEIIQKNQILKSEMILKKAIKAYETFPFK